ncbi:MAG TPA: CBS domain-containing protein [Candidatus Gallacutalibacter stercoravium]|mgnify:CR=1 FL=1|nr:CBS domain-containing protein [Candidatus Gallacutalibacter stercoravium]
MQETVQDLMSKRLVAVLPGDTAQEAARLMKEHNIGAVPVVSGGELRGMLTDRDIVLRCIAEGKDPASTRAGELMSRDIAYVTPDRTVQDAVRMMSAEQVRRLPVVRDGYVDGMISLADIARRHAGPEVAAAISEISTTHIGPAGAVRTR